MFHYFYKITNNINGKYYYGVHNTDNLDDGYMGSGKNIKRAINKYGIQNFTKEIIKFFNSSDEAFDYENLIVNNDEISNNECYNLVLGGKNLSTKNCIVVKTEDSEEYHLISIDEYYKNKDLYKTPQSGIIKTDEQKLQIRNKMTPKDSKNNRVWVNNNNVVKYLRKELLDEYLNNGWSLGRKGYKPRKNCQGKILKQEIQERCVKE